MYAGEPNYKLIRTSSGALVPRNTWKLHQFNWHDLLMGAPAGRSEPAEAIADGNRPSSTQTVALCGLNSTCGNNWMHAPRRSGIPWMDARRSNSVCSLHACRAELRKRGCLRERLGQHDSESLRYSCNWKGLSMHCGQVLSTLSGYACLY